MEAEALVLIEDDKESQKLIVTWPVVGAQTFETPEDLIERWATVAMVDPEDVARRMSLLFDNGMIADGGMVDPMARAWIRTRLRGQIPKHLLPTDPTRPDGQ